MATAMGWLARLALSVRSARGDGAFAPLPLVRSRPPRGVCNRRVPFSAHRAFGRGVPPPYPGCRRARRSARCMMSAERRVACPALHDTRRGVLWRACPASAEACLRIRHGARFGSRCHDRRRPPVA